jgi:hypothetical protein
MATETQTQAGLTTSAANSQSQVEYPREPLQLKGVLDQYSSFDVTPVIGREFKDVNLAEWLHAPNSDELIRDLAITSTSRQPSENSSLTHTLFSFPTRRCILPRAE